MAPRVRTCPGPTRALAPRAITESTAGTGATRVAAAARSSVLTARVWTRRAVLGTFPTRASVMRDGQLGARASVMWMSTSALFLTHHAQR